MNAEFRFILAIVLMLGVLYVGSLFAPELPPSPGGEPVAELADTAAARTSDPAANAGAPGSGPAVGEAQTGTSAENGATVSADPQLPTLAPTGEVPAPEVTPTFTASEIRVEGPLYRYTFSDLGARAQSIELLHFQSFTREGPVEMVSAPMGMLGTRIVVDADTVDLRTVPFEVSPSTGLRLEAGGGPETLTFRYRHPTQPFSFEVRYTFRPDSYAVEVAGSVQGLSRALLVTDLGSGPAPNEVDVEAETESLTYVANHLQEGVQSTSFADVSVPFVQDGPFHWVAVRTQYFVAFILRPETQGGDEYLGGVFAAGLPDQETRRDVAVSQSLGAGGNFAYRFFGGPQDLAALSALGSDADEVNPVGWGFLRPVLRPIIGAITWVLIFFHTNLSLGYGWVLMLVGVLMRIVLFPLNHKAMRAQLRNMAVQPLLKEIQTKYKDQPEKLQKELMKLYKEHGFNPLAGCWPMLLPWPVLIALFFVFRNTIELRGVAFAWLPDLASQDPYYILPVLLGVSMFLMQWITLRTMDDSNPQMKMMLWFLPIFMVVMFAALPAGLNLYYLTANIATLPQSWWIAQERKKVRAKVA